MVGLARCWVGRFTSLTDHLDLRAFHTKVLLTLQEEWEVEEASGLEEDVYRRNAHSEVYVEPREPEGRVWMRE